MEKREDAGGRVEVVMVWSWLSTKLSSPWLLYFGQSWGWVEVWVKVWIVVKFRAFKHETPTWTPTLAKLGNWEIELGLSWGTSWRSSWACLNDPNVWASVGHRYRNVFLLGMAMYVVHLCPGPHIDIECTTAVHAMQSKLTIVIHNVSGQWLFSRLRNQQ